MYQKGFISALFLLQTTFATQCGKYQYANFSTNTCDGCHHLCNSGWCKGPSVDDCLVCANTKQYRDFLSWQCLDSCSQVRKQNAETSTKLISGDGIIKYCLETDFFVDSYEQQNNLVPSLELGTKQFPFRGLDDAFRTIFNENYSNQSIKFVINIKHGANLNVHSEDMPLIVLNSNVELRPYSDNSNIDIKSNLTQIQIFHQSYNRPQSMNGFNPTFRDVNQIIEYNIAEKLSKGLVDPNSMNSQKFKFVVYNSNFKVSAINFTEITSKDYSANALFYMYYGEYKTLTVEYCNFNLYQLLAMTQEGVNFRLLNSVINIENIVRVFIFVAKNVCSLYEKYWIANNFQIDNCIFKGKSIGGHNYLFITMFPVNVTVTNTQFLNIQWVDSQNSMSNEHFSFKCLTPVYTRFVFENNTLQNTDETRISYIGFQMNLNEDNKQEAYFINNKFINFQFFNPGVFRGIKAGGMGFKVFFINNYFEKIINVREASTAVSFQAEEITIDNITIKDSVISCFASFQNQRSIIKNIKFINVSRMDQNLAPGLSQAFLIWTLSQDSIMSAIIFHNCEFAFSRAINIVQSSNITLINLQIINSQANNNNLVHISLSKDLNFENLTVDNITKNSPGMVALFNVFQLQSWGKKDHTMKYTVFNLNFSQSSISVLNIETYQPLEYESSILISFHNIRIHNINIKGKEALFQFNPTNQTKLSFNLNESVISNNYLELGHMIDLRQNSNRILIADSYFFNNSGMILKAQPYEMNDKKQTLNVQISQTSFFKNWANESLLHISANSLLTINNSSFEDNFSLGRGSIIFSEFYLSKVSISQSIFKKNYAVTGGVFFSSLNGFIEVKQSSFIENFALSGGVYYSQNEGYAYLRDNNYTLNIAMKGSLIYAINCYNSITVSGGLISRNGFRYHPKFQNPYIFNIQLDSMDPGLGLYFDQIFIKKIQEIFSTDKNIFMKYLQDNEMSHQIQMVKANVKLNDKILITEQELLIIAQSQSTIEIREIIYQNSQNINETIFIEQSNLVLNNATIQNISSSAPILKIESDSIVASSELFFNNCQSSLMKILSSKCSFDKFKAEAISLNKNAEQKSIQIISMLYSSVNFTNSVLQNINKLTNIGSDSELMIERQNNQEIKREKIVLYGKKSIL